MREHSMRFRCTPIDINIRHFVGRIEKATAGHKCLMNIFFALKGSNLFIIIGGFWLSFIAALVKG